MTECRQRPRPRGFSPSKAGGGLTSKASTEWAEQHQAPNITSRDPRARSEGQSPKKVVDRSAILNYSCTI